MTTTTTEDVYLGVGQIAKRLGISPDTVERYIRPAVLSGEIRSFKIGSRWAISWLGVLSFLERNHKGGLS